MHINQFILCKKYLDKHFLLNIEQKIHFMNEFLEYFSGVMPSELSNKYNKYNDLIIDIKNLLALKNLPADYFVLINNLQQNLAEIDKQLLVLEQELLQLENLPYQNIQNHLYATKVRIISIRDLISRDMNLYQAKIATLIEAAIDNLYELQKRLLIRINSYDSSDTISLSNKIIKDLIFLFNKLYSLLANIKFFKAMFFIERKEFKALEAKLTDSPVLAQSKVEEIEVKFNKNFLFLRDLQNKLTRDPRITDLQLFEEKLDSIVETIMALDLDDLSCDLENYLTEQELYNQLIANGQRVLKKKSSNNDLASHEFLGAIELLKKNISPMPFNPAISGMINYRKTYKLINDFLIFDFNRELKELFALGGSKASQQSRMDLLLTKISGMKKIFDDSPRSKNFLEEFYKSSNYSQSNRNKFLLEINYSLDLAAKALKNLKQQLPFVSIGNVFNKIKLIK